MTTKVVRGQLMTFIATPLDSVGAASNPDSVVLYLNYPHADGASSTDTVTMADQNDGTWSAEFDTSAAEPGALFVSLRATSPTAAEDLKYTIVANTANPDP
jgi:hypothetical protein